MTCPPVRLGVAAALATVLFALPVMLSGLSGAGHTLDHRSHTVEVSLFQFGFEPGVITVNQGDTVTLILNATDVAHGFFIDGYGVDVTVVPGAKVSYTFTADKAGHFNIRCSMNCGTFHPYMVGRFEVNENWSFPIAVGAALALSALALAFAWRMPQVGG